MLERLLAEIRSGGTFETGDLAARLGTTPELLGAMLEHLMRAGYIQAYQACDNTCGGCGLRNSCHRPQSDDISAESLRLFTFQVP
jgi:Mn-dependent DtxR family transcriptional regulator